MCQICKAVGVRLEAAHLVARCELGRVSEKAKQHSLFHSRSNLRVLCQPCHSRFDKLCGVTAIGRRRLPDEGPFLDLLAARKSLLVEWDIPAEAQGWVAR